jgi:hypothetical protein
MSALLARPRTDADRGGVSSGDRYNCPGPPFACQRIKGARLLPTGGPGGYPPPGGLMNHPVAKPTNAEDIPVGRTGAAGGPSSEPVASLLLRGAPPTRRTGCFPGSPEGTPPRIAPEAQGGPGADPRRGQSEGHHGCAPDRLLDPRDAGAGGRFRASDRHLDVDFTTARADRPLGPPTPLFALARLTGRAAEVAGQRARNKPIDPTADDIGPETRPSAPLVDREAGAEPRG